MLLGRRFAGDADVSGQLQSSASDGNVPERVARAWALLLSDWLSRAADTEHFGFFDTLDAAGRPQLRADKTILVQARMLFTLSHLALITGGETQLVELAKRQAGALAAFRKAAGLYCRAVRRDGTPTGRREDGIARSYDQSFVLLGLVTWNRIAPSVDTETEIEACWSAIGSQLTDATTGLLLEHDGVMDPAAPHAPPRAQNPHMHLYEACLQAFEMTGAAVWLDRASMLRNVALRYFFDEETGSIREWIAPDLADLPGAAGLRREPGHQCEWAWLLRREASFSGNASLDDLAVRLMNFADRHGFAQSGRMRGAALDAVSATGQIQEEAFLLWPQTEAIKVFAQRHAYGDIAAGPRALDLVALVFDRWFSATPFWINRVDSAGLVLWPETLTRLFYHLALALTEGARAGLWAVPRGN